MLSLFDGVGPVLSLFGGVGPVLSLFGGDVVVGDDVASPVSLLPNKFTCVCVCIGVRVSVSNMCRYVCCRTRVGSFVEMRELFEIERVVIPTSVGVASWPLFLGRLGLFAQCIHKSLPSVPLAQQLACAKFGQSPTPSHGHRVSDGCMHSVYEQHGFCLRFVRLLVRRANTC